ncbi:MAG: HDOD domain-containing protein [Desulfobacteraceae bacterium]|jgi:putative nucleotidyltransferase with HDIG domain
MYAMDSDEILKKLNMIKDLPTLPVIALEINRMLANDSTTVDFLSKTIEKDQAIVSKLLKLVNSSFFGVRSKVTTVQEAVVRLGFNSVRNVVVSVSVFESLVLDNAEDIDFNIEDFWTHSLAVAMTSRYLSEESGIQDPDDCFVAGLLHDIGLIIIARFFPDILVKIVRQVKEQNVSIYDAEKEIIPLRHNKIGELIAKKWQLPPAVCDTLKYHHTPNKGAVNPELVTLVHLGDIIVRRFYTTSINPVRDSVNPILSNINPSSEKKLDYLNRSAENWFPDVKDKIREACEFFIKKKEPVHHG